MIKRIKFASVPITDQDVALDFYTNKLGFEIVTDQPMGDQRWIELAIPGAETGLVLFTMEGQEDRIGTPQHITFMSDDVQQTYESLVGRGVEFDGPPDSQPWGTFALFRDPDENLFVLSSR